ncbi:MAG: hypothetical protein CBD74_07140, partial [Saprospirales bacterium TMED214]
MPEQLQSAEDLPHVPAACKSAKTPTITPTTRSERLVILDVLRGVATLGILIMNIQFFSMISSAYLNPTAFGDLKNANYWVWYLSHLFADMKFMSIFSML